MWCDERNRHWTGLLVSAALLGLASVGCQPERSAPGTPSPSHTTQNEPPTLATSSVASVTSTNSPGETVTLEKANAQELQEAATLALNKEDFPNAIEAYSRLVKLKPLDEEAHFSLAFCYARTREVDKAIAHYEQCIQLLPEYSEAHNNLGNLLMSLKNYEGAERHLRMALKIEPESWSANNNMGKLLALQSKYPEAISHFKEAVRLNDKNLEARFNMGVSYGQIGMLDEAEKALVELLQINPTMELAQQVLLKLRAGRKRGLPPAPPLRPE